MTTFDPRALLLLAVTGTALGQTLPPGYVDPLPALRAATAAIGELRCVQFSGTGYGAMVGQGRVQEQDWPRGEPLADYTRTIDYHRRTSTEEFTRKPGMNPQSWKYGVGWLGGTPLQKNPRQTFVVAGSDAWSTDGESSPPISAPESAELWQLDVWLTPHGFLRAAMAPGADPKAVWRWELVESGRDGATTGAIEKVTVVSITVLGKYRVNATINSAYLPQRIETKFPHPVLGDMNVEHEYSDWREVSGVKFPAGWHSHQGYDDERFKPTVSGGHNAFGGEFPDIRPNVCGPAREVPDVVRTARVPPERVDVEELAEGVWLLGGSTHNSVAIEFRDFIAVVEAPLNERRSLAVIEKIAELVPEKPIRYVVNTHDHFDHLGGIRTYLHIGATIVTHKRHRVFYEEEILNYVPRTLEPDLVTLYQPTEIREGYTMETVAENYVISDESRNLQVSYVQPLQHVEGMLMAYLPKERIAIEADLYDSLLPGEPAPEETSPANSSFFAHVERLGLEVEIIAPIHGRAARWSDLLALLAKSK